MSWYRWAKQVLALRKNSLRVDMRVYPAIDSTGLSGNEADAAVRSIMTAAIESGLDLIGLIGADGPAVGWRARQIAEADNLDIWVVPGEEYLCSDKMRYLVFNMQNPLTPGLDSQSAAKEAHANGGFVIATQLSRTQAKQLNELAGRPEGADAVEIYNAATGSYVDLDIDLPTFISSASKSASDLTNTNVYTLVKRADLEAVGLVPEGEGVDYEPDYMKNSRSPLGQPGVHRPGAAAAPGENLAPMPAEIPLPQAPVVPPRRA